MPNRLKFELSELALKDINNIWIHTASKWSKTQANKYYKELFKRINLICDNPRIGKEIKHIKPHHRILQAKSHLIIYKRLENTIFIDRVLHKKMDIEDRLTKKHST